MSFAAGSTFDAYVRAPNATWAADGEDALAVGLLPSGPIRKLIGPASWLWTALADDLNVREAIDVVLSRSDDAPQDAESHLQQVASNLASAGLLVKP